MGVVFRALDRTIGRSVAVKVIRSQPFPSPEESELLRLRFAREAAAAGMLSHANIVTVYHFGEERDYQFLVMEYIVGTSLDNLIAEGSPLDLEACLSILRQLANALDYAHNNGVFHRDVKPANILLRSDGQVKITDFGIARIANQTMTQTGMTMGTPSYMAPEQILAARIDGRADQFSMAVFMFELLTGRKPFQAPTDNALMFAIVSGERPVAHEVNPKLSRSVSEVLARGMAKEADERFTSCVAFARSLEEAFSSEGERARIRSERAKATVLSERDDRNSASESEQVSESEPVVLGQNKRNPSSGGRWSVWVVGIGVLLVGTLILFLASRSWRSDDVGKAANAAAPISVLQPATVPTTAPLSALELRPIGYVNDFARVLDADSHAAIEAYCGTVERLTGAQIAVALVDSLEGHSIDGIANRMFRQWGIGKQGKDNGLLLLLAVRDRTDRVEVGYGLESTITDQYAAGVLQRIRPELQQGNYGGAILTAVQQLGNRLAETKGLDLKSGKPASQLIPKGGRASEPATSVPVTPPQ